ncbi:hypothetical protein [Bacillus sp. CHD6a]|uniref:hypothetical protein n=1 Tax=Bacillus sp. CHD6a TaxID=1643452 RepID=UPI0006CC6459|nr:hypothetical protein [Bacillus sp. CHD6a]KPB05115.1 hypothetical protein AAV98_08520 [Bacillus sp. CHD6a]
MSDYQQYIAEKEKIDFFIHKGFRIKEVEENLEGSFLVLERRDSQKEISHEETLHIKHADSRKYFASLLIKQHQQQEN